MNIHSCARQTLILAAVLALGGCAKLAHLQQLLTLKAYSDNQDAQEKFINDQDRSFEKVLAQARTGEWTAFDTQKKILKNFGPPVFKRNIEREGQQEEMWLYREPTNYFDGDKVYLYFDPQGKLVSWEHFVPAEKERSDDAGAGCMQEP